MTGRLKDLDGIAKHLKRAAVLALKCEIPLADVRKALDRAYLTQLLLDHSGNRTHAARASGLHRNSLLRMIHKMRISVPTPRRNVLKFVPTGAEKGRI